MVASAIRFYEGLVPDIRDGEKYQTIRYDWSDIPDDNSVLNAVSTQKGDVFARIRIESTERMSVDECVDRDLEGHKDYSDKQEFLNDMSTYYPEIREDDEIILFHFSVDEWIRE